MYAFVYLCSFNFTFLSNKSIGVVIWLVIGSIMASNMGLVMGSVMGLFMRPVSSLQRMTRETKTALRSHYSQIMKSHYFWDNLNLSMRLNLRRLSTHKWLQIHLQIQTYLSDTKTYIYVFANQMVLLTHKSTYLTIICAIDLEVYVYLYSIYIVYSMYI